MPRYPKIAALALALTTTGTIAHAASGTRNDALSINTAQVSLSQAVANAEQRVNGRATRAVYERIDQGWAYDIEVVQGQKVFDFTVDAQDGSVLASSEDRVDQDHEQGVDRDHRRDHENGLAEDSGMGPDHGLDHDSDAGEHNRNSN